MPVEFHELLVEVQKVFEIYDLLDSTYAPGDGAYLGKSLVGIAVMLSASKLNPEFNLFYLTIIKIIDKFNRDVSSQKIAQELKKVGKKDN